MKFITKREIYHSHIEGIFATLGDAANDIGVTPSAIKQAIDKGTCCKHYAYTYFELDDNKILALARSVEQNDKNEQVIKKIQPTSLT